MRRIVLRVSGLAKLGLLTAMTGVALALYARSSGAGSGAGSDAESGTEWARIAGLLMIFGGAGLYLIERLRAWRRRHD